MTSNDDTLIKLGRSSHGIWPVKFICNEEELSSLINRNISRIKIIYKLKGRYCLKNSCTQIFQNLIIFIHEILIRLYEILIRCFQTRQKDPLIVTQCYTFI